ncbi:hypothetical protein RSOLAG1IB_09015 [Rhizoctonia solani AG-1 IB]|uniref:Uncharacterized protein n=1 Tax=Thanatephorus cucumeris (strain AG1-IB / isolate 7/3/14) TaxID=1108050 RepID=A0A0B7FS62_THACB|nr:hypothetical protein RSOLAG1IB_09015 [Rhizoctonia solani AG-1 IB]
MCQQCNLLASSYNPNSSDDADRIEVSYGRAEKAPCVLTNHDHHEFQAWATFLPDSQACTQLFHFSKYKNWFKISPGASKLRRLQIHKKDTLESYTGDNTRLLRSILRDGL